MIPSNYSKDPQLLGTGTPFARLKTLFWAGFFITLAVLPNFSHAADNPSSDRFRLGPRLDEIDESPAEEKDPQTLFNFDQKEWDRVRRSIDGGYEDTVTVSSPTVVGSTTTATPPKPPPGLLSVELPYESSLSITGRKLIKLDIQNTHITAERARELGGKQDTQSFNMEQELQARIQGTVARKTTINVNFDDTKENVKDFSVVYKGDPDEVVQEAAFGDIVLSLPSTEFVNYNKQLFGIRAALKYKRLGLMMIGSRTKGTTETKRFTGTTTRQQKFIKDTEYVRRKFYDLTFTTAATNPGMGTIGAPFPLPLNGTQPEQVFIEDALSAQATFYDIATPTDTTKTINLRMRLMSPGVEYSMDRIKGVITFNTPIPENVRVAVDFTLANGTRLSSLVAGNKAVLIKDALPESPHVSQELKRFYTVGDKNIIRDNGLGNFVLRVLDKDQVTEIGNTLNPIQKYPDTIEMKFETGIFELKNRLPFDDIYVTNVSASAALHAVFSVEYQSIVRTFTLKPNIVLQSETVLVNGRKVARDLDYFIDYDIGIITFFNEDLIRESTVIEVTYEFAPFGGVLGETLVGARGTYDILENKQYSFGAMEKWTAGSTVLYNFAAKPSAPPDIRSTPSSLLVTEGDTQIKGLKFGSFPLKTNLAIEAARSDENPNLYGKAIIDSMEGIKQDDASSMLKESWQPAANPGTLSGHNLVSNFQGRENPSSHLTWTDADVTSLDSGGNSVTQKALQISYKLNVDPAASSPEQVSLINVISTGGRDFSKKTTLELEIIGGGANGQNVELEVQYGSFNEDADGDGDLDTEDRIPFDGILNLGEDVGFLFDSPGSDLTDGSGDDATVGYGAGNARMDSEDLNGDRVLTPLDLPATDTPLFLISAAGGETDTQGVTVTDLGFSERRLFHIPLRFTDSEKERMTAVKQVRVTVRNASPGNAAREGTIQIVRLAMVGNSYEPATIVPDPTISTMTVLAVNSIDNIGEYTSLVGNPAFNELYKDALPTSGSKEQALALDFALQPGSSGTTRNSFSAPRDFSKHEQFKFFINTRTKCTVNCGKVFLQAGSETDYQQITIDLANIEADPIWTLIVVKQSDRNTDGSTDAWESPDPNVVVTSVGAAPTLKQVAQLKVGVVNVSTTAAAINQVRINEIHVAEPRSRPGHAKKYAFDSAMPNWGDFGAMYRDVDRNWQTPTTAITNQDSTQSNMYVNFNRLSFLPMTFKTTRDVTVTPSAFQSSQNGLVSFLDEGLVDRITNVSTAKLIVPNWPVLDVNYTNDKNINSATARDEYNDTVAMGASYSPKTTFDMLPGKKITFRPIPNSITLLQTEKRTRLRYGELSELTERNISTAPFSSTDLDQESSESEARMAFKPWNGFTFNPTYKYREEREKRKFRYDEVLALAPTGQKIETDSTPRAISQAITASGNLRLLKWLDPRYTYSLTGTETNGLPTQTNTTAYMLKTITRNSQGEISAAIQMAQVIPAFNFTNSMNLNGSYKLENGDTYNNMPQDTNWRNQLWVGTPLVVNSSSGTATLPQRVEATDRRTYRTNLAWQPFSAYRIAQKRMKPLTSMSVTSNYLRSKEDGETTGTLRHIDSLTFPDLIVTINDTEDFFNVKKAIDNSRLVLKTNTRLTETRNVNKVKTDTWGVDYQFQFWKKLDFSTSYNLAAQRDDNLLTNSLNSKSDTVNYSIQTRVPWRVWAFTPRYEHSQTDARDSIQPTNDIRNDIYTLQIYGDISKPLGIRFGRKEIGLANRMILNSTVKWDKKRSNINPGTNYLDTYSATLSGDYTISQNFRMAIGGNFSQEKHHPEFKKLDQTVFGVNSTLTIQF